MAQRLRFSQIGFAAAQPVFGLLAFIDIDRHAVPLDDPPLSVAQRFTANMVPTIFAVRQSQAVHSLVGRSGLDCAIEGLYSFCQVVRV